MRVFHITEPAVWDQAVSTGSYTGSTRGASLDEVGYVHCSYADQVERVAGYLYADERVDLLVLEIETDRVPAEVRVENLEGGDELFPHIYGPIPVHAVVDVRSLARTGPSAPSEGDLTP